MYQKHSAEKYRELRAGLEVFEWMYHSSILNRDEANSFFKCSTKSAKKKWTELK